MVTLKGLMLGLGSAEAIFRLKLISLEKCFIAGVGSSLDRPLDPGPASDQSPAQLTVRRSQLWGAQTDFCRSQTVSI